MSINSVAEEFERLEVEVENILATDPQGEVLEMETTETTTSNTASTDVVITEVKDIVPKKTILIPPSRDDPNRNNDHNIDVEMRQWFPARKQSLTRETLPNKPSN
ncbi:hypothetical protein V9T40_008829 [Parthenolecanium corni]|uniref:Uncharacterized protein n=1 Tax=Parthenolecanium corni TaxID=536013 RepID=A0AAN9U0C3_9HEMI